MEKKQSDPERDPEAFAKGRNQALQDIAAGKLRILRHGHPGPWGDDLEDLMRERFGVTVEQTSGCIVDPLRVSYDDGYNEIVMEEIDRVHGPGSFASVLEEAKKRAQERHDRYFKERGT